VVSGQRLRAGGVGFVALVLIAAEAGEFRGLLRFLEDVRVVRGRIDFLRTGRLNGRRVVVAANGQGPGLAAAAVEQAAGIEETGVEGLVSTGYCGALDETLRAGGIFVATSVNGQPVAQPICDLPFRSGPLLSVDRIVGTAAEKRQLAAAGAMAVEMEAAAVGAAALTRGVPFYCVRVVSDEAGEDLPLDFNRFRNPDGRLSRRRIAAAALKHPGRIPALIKLDRSANRASQALGEFLVNCQF